MMSAGDRQSWLWRSGRALLVSPATPLALVAAIMLLGLLEQLSQAAGHDLAWLLLATGRLLDGADVYGGELFEWNQPLVLYILSLPVAISRVLDVSEISAARFYVVALCGFSLMGCNAMLKVLLGEERSAMRRSLWIALAWTFLLLPGASFAQREHLIALLIAPQMLLVAAIATPRQVPRRMGIAAGVGTALAISIKPHFALLVLCWELYLAARRKSLTAWVRPDVMAALATGVVYLASLFVLTPGYPMQVVPVALDTYWVYQATLCHIVKLPDLLLIPCGAAAIYLVRRCEALYEYALVLLVTAAGCYLAALAQGTGWPYHFLPYFGAMGVLLLLPLWRLLNVTAASAPASPGGAQCFAAILLGAALVVAVVALPGRVGDTIRDGSAWRRGETVGLVAVLQHALEQHAADGSVYVISPSLVSIFPAVNHAGVEWTSRFSAIFLPAAIERFRRGDPDVPARLTRERVDEIEMFLRDAVIEDLRRRPPNLILIDHVRRRKVFAGVPFDFLDYFLQDPRFAEIWAQYRPIANIGRFDAAVRH